MFPYFRPQDIADILIMSFLVYQLYHWFQNTKALQVVIGIGFLTVLYFVTKNLDLFMTSWILQQLGTVLFVLIIVIFQTEIRQALYRVSLLRNLFDHQPNVLRLDLMELSKEIFALAEKHTGAIVVFQRREPLDEYLMHGTLLDSLVSAQLIGTIFRDGTPLHDGAVVIKDDRITQASCHLPLSSSAELPQHCGTRHRAALGLTEKSDAVVVIVSEERGEVNLALAGKMEKIDTPERLSEKLHLLLIPPDQEVVKISFREKIFSNLRPKIVTAVFVLVSWLIITAKQGGLLTVSVPIKFHNLPDDLVFVKNSPEVIEVQAKIFSKLIPSPKQIEIVADVDLGRIREGSNALTIRTDDLQLPLGIVVNGINPSIVKVTAEKKVRKALLVKPRTRGTLPAGHFLRKIKVDPPTVMAVGPAHAISLLETVATEDVDLSNVRRSVTVEKSLLQPAPQVSFLHEEPVKVQLVVSGR